MNEENLIPFKKGEQRQKDLGKLGGIASGESKRKRKAFKEALMLALETEIEDGKLVQDVGIEALIKKYMDGDLAVFTAIRDTIGEKPKDVVEVNDVTNKKFDEICSQIGGDGLDE